MPNPLPADTQDGLYLWLYLRSLGFPPEAVTTTGKRINLGAHMFDKPNHDAFYLVTHFLLSTLEPGRFREAYRDCWPICSRKSAADFRKITIAWLKEIMYESSGSAVVPPMASLFLSPGGPKFILLMLQLATHVMLQEMKTLTTDSMWVPEKAAVPSSSRDMALKRLKLTRARCIKAAAQQEHLQQQFQRRAQSLVKSIEVLRTKRAKYDHLLKCQEGGVSPEGEDLDEKLQKVRSLWSAIDEMLSVLREHPAVVAAMLKGDADHFALDGTGMALKVPHVLVEKIEQFPEQLRTGNLYEAGQLNPLCMLELMVPALRLLWEERSRVAGPTPLTQLRPQELQTKIVQATRVLEELKVLRHKISMEEIPEVKNATQKLQADWDRRWRNTLEEKPLASFLSGDPALSFLSPMVPLSFEPEAESAYDSSVFCRYAATLLPEEEEQTVIQSQELLGASCPELNRSTRSGVTRISGAVGPPAGDTVFFANTMLQDLLHTPSPPPEAPMPTPRQPTQLASTKTIPSRCKVAPVKNKAKILDWECDNLADQFAEAITTSPVVDRNRDGLALEDLLCTLVGDPFSIRRQLPRTPESLNTAVRLSSPSSTISSLTPAAVGHSSPTSISPQHQQASLVSAPTWDPLGTVALHNFSDMGGSGGDHFSLNDETMPELPDENSLLSFSDEDDSGLRLPPCGQPAGLGRGNKSAFLAQMTPTTPRVGLGTPGSESCFTLALEALEGLTPPREEYSMPMLIPISPMDHL